MPCDVEIIINKMNELIDKSIKGNAASITQNKKGDFEVRWGEEFRVKNKSQAVHMAEQKVRTTEKLLDKEGFAPEFGPYLDIDKSLTNMVLIYKIEPVRLKKAIELRNKAEEEEEDLENYLTQEDIEFFQQQAADQELLDQQEKEISLIDEALLYVDKLSSDMYRDMMRASPSEFLKFVADQYWNMRNLRKSGEFDFTPGTGLDAFPDEIIEIAKQMYPQNPEDQGPIQPDGLPPITPRCS